MLTATRSAKPTPHPLMTRREVAELFRVDPTTVDHWRRDGELAGAVVPLPKGRFRYRREVIVAMLGQHQ